MKTRSKFSLYAQPRTADINRLGKRGFTTFFAIGTVNPMGPTLNALVGEGFFWKEKAQDLFHLMLNPFRQECHEIGSVQIDQEWRPIEDLQPFFSLPFGSCPTLLIPSALYSRDVARSVFVGLLERFHRGSAVLNHLRHHPGDPWSRVKAEMSEFAAVAGSKTEVKTPSLTSKEAHEFATLQLAPKNLAEEFKAFLFAWEGSIEFTDLGCMAMKKKEFLRLFGALVLTARVPFAKNLIDHPQLLDCDSEAPGLH